MYNRQLEVPALQEMMASVLPFFRGSWLKGLSQDILYYSFLSMSKKGNRTVSACELLFSPKDRKGEGSESSINSESDFSSFNMAIGGNLVAETPPFCLP
jgi:hypothetical protein